MNTQLAFSDEQAMVLDSAMAFCRDNSSIGAVRALLSSETGFDQNVWLQQQALGWAGISIPEQYGGAGLGLAGLLPILESMGRHLLTGPLLSSALAAQAILSGGNESQRQAYLPAIADGKIATLAIAENADWGRKTFACGAVRDGATLCITGTKKYVLDADVAELMVVAVMFEGAPALLVLEGDVLATIAKTQHTLIDQTRRASTLDFNGLQVPASALLTEADATTIEELLVFGAAMVGAEATGACISALQLIVEYLNTRKQFGKLIGAYQALKHPSVDILNAVEGARSLLYHAATLLADNRVLSNDAEIACRMLKAQAADALLQAGDRAVQFHGGMGFTFECDAQLYLRRALWASQQFGDSAHQRKRLAPLLLDNA